MKETAANNEVAPPRPSWLVTFAAAVDFLLRRGINPDPVLRGPATAMIASMILGAALATGCVVVGTLAIEIWGDLWRHSDITWESAWSRSYGRLTSGDLVIIGAVTIAIASGIGLFLALLVLPDLIGNGPAGRAMSRCLRIVSTLVWPVAIAILIAFGLVVAAANLDSLLLISKISSSPAHFVLPIALPALAGLLMFRLSRVASVCARTLPHTAPNPVCEGCGYDLTHPPGEGRCPECGLALDESLTPLRRSGASWQTNRSIISWLKTSFDVLLYPRRFYRTLRLRDDPRTADTFAFYHYPAASLGAMIWMFYVGLHDLSSFSNYEWIQLFEFIAFGAVFTPLLGWVINRTVAAIIAVPVLVGGRFRGPHWLRVVRSYETAFLWVLCGFNGFLITSFFLFNDWIRSLQMNTLGHAHWILAIPQEPFFLLMGNAGLFLFWLLRYRVILRAIRWSNY